MQNHHRCTTRSHTIMYRDLKTPIEEDSESNSGSDCDRGSNYDSDCDRGSNYDSDCDRGSNCDSDCDTDSGYGMSPYNHMCASSPYNINTILTATSIYLVLLFWVSMVEIVKNSRQC
jgi:hypothetical protein